MTNTPEGTIRSLEPQSKRRSGKSKEVVVRDSQTLGINIRQRPILYLMAIPVLAWYLIFTYAPMFGIVTAFQNYLPVRGFLDSQWVGLDHFRRFFGGMTARRLIRNTFMISFLDLVVGFPAPIIFALLLNEIRSTKLKKVTQTVTYIPHFISLVVVAGLIYTFTKSSSPIAQLVAWVKGTTPENLLTNPDYFRQIFVLSGIWQGFGWGSIIYFAALTGIDTQLYEAAALDGASRLKQVIHVTLPGIAPTIIIMLILRIGQLMSVGHEKIILLYAPITYSTSDVISSHVYRSGLENMNFSYATAIGLFNSLINLIFVVGANTISRKATQTSLW